MAIEMRNTELRLVREQDGLNVALGSLQGLWTEEQCLAQGEAYATHGILGRCGLAAFVLLAGFVADVSAVLDA